MTTKWSKWRSVREVWVARLRVILKDYMDSYVVDEMTDEEAIATIGKHPRWAKDWHERRRNESE